MAMTRTRYRMQTTLTFLTEQLVSAEQELELLRSKAPGDAAVAERLRSLEARRLALVEAVRQFDPELDLAGIAGASAASGAERTVGQEAADVVGGGSHG